MLHLCFLVAWSLLSKRVPIAPLHLSLSGLFRVVGEANVKGRNLVINFTSVKLYTRSGLHSGVNLMPSPSNDFVEFRQAL